MAASGTWAVTCTGAIWTASCSRSTSTQSCASCRLKRTAHPWMTPCCASCWWTHMAGPHHTAFVKQPRDPQVKSALCAQRVCAGLCRQNHAPTRPSCCWPPCAVLCVQALVCVCLRLWSLAAVGRGDTAACAGHTGAHTPAQPEIACCSTHRAEQLRCAVPGRRHSSPAWLSLHPAACHLAHFTSLVSWASHVSRVPAQASTIHGPSSGLLAMPHPHPC